MSGDEDPRELLERGIAAGERRIQQDRDREDKLAVRRMEAALQMLDAGDTPRFLDDLLRMAQRFVDEDR